MRHAYQPTWLLNEIYDLSPETLAKHKIKAIFTDLDNTLIAWNNPDGTKQLHSWIRTMQVHQIPVIVVSNNKATRVARAVEKLDLPYVSRAMKPFTKGIKQALRDYHLNPSEVVMVGDQIMTDIRAGNGSGVRTILVKPIVDSDGWNTQFNRFIEKFVMRRLKKQNPNMKWSNQLND